MMHRSSKAGFGCGADAADGKGAFGCIFSLAVLGIALFVAMRVAPPYLSYKQLESDTKSEAARAGAHFLLDETIVKELLPIAEKNDVILTSDNIRIRRFADQLEINIHYVVPVDLIFYQHELEFDIKAASYIGRL